MKLRKFRDSDSLNAKAARRAKLEGGACVEPAKLDTTLAPQDYQDKRALESLPKVPGAITIAGFKAMALLAYEDRYEPEGAPRTR